MEREHCMLLALPYGRDQIDVLQQSSSLHSGFISYLQQKQAAGIVNVAPPGSTQVTLIHTRWSLAGWLNDLIFFSFAI